MLELLKDAHNNLVINSNQAAWQDHVTQTERWRCLWAVPHINDMQGARMVGFLVTIILYLEVGVTNLKP